VFWAKNRLQNWFLGQKSISPNFSTTTVAEIWAKQAIRYLSQQATRRLLLDWVWHGWQPQGAWVQHGCHTRSAWVWHGYHENITLKNTIEKK